MDLLQEDLLGEHRVDSLPTFIAFKVSKKSFTEENSNRSNSTAVPAHKNYENARLRILRAYEKSLTLADIDVSFSSPVLPCIIDLNLDSQSGRKLGRVVGPTEEALRQFMEKFV